MYSFPQMTAAVPSQHARERRTVTVPIRSHRLASAGGVTGIYPAWKQRYTSSTVMSDTTQRPAALSDRRRLRVRHAGFLPKHEEQEPPRRIVTPQRHHMRGAGAPV